MLILEIIKYFANFICFYVFSAIQLILFITCTTLLCLGAMKGKNKTILSIFLSCVMVCISVPVVYAFANTEKQSYNSVVHAGGVLGNSVYLNSQEGFMFYANNGYSIIEIDFLYTSDKEIVGSHLFEHLPGFNLENRPTMKEFESAKLDGRYTGITYDWLIEELKMFPDIKVVFDSKEDDSIAILEDMVETAHQKDFAIESRMIVQVYSIENYNEIKNNPALNFTTFWFTNYKAKYTNFQIQE